MDHCCATPCLTCVRISVCVGVTSKFASGECRRWVCDFISQSANVSECTTSVSSSMLHVLVFADVAVNMTDLGSECVAS